jgi:hypothetical protein
MQSYPTNPVDTGQTYSSFQEVWYNLRRCLERLLHRDQSVEKHFDDLLAVESLLAALPLASDEFALVASRMGNARRYLRSNEIGAARYEIGMLASTLRNLQAQQVPHEPRRRLRRATARR